MIWTFNVPQNRLAVKLHRLRQIRWTTSTLPWTLALHYSVRHRRIRFRYSGSLSFFSMVKNSKNPKQNPLDRKHPLSTMMPLSTLPAADKERTLRCFVMLRPFPYRFTGILHSRSMLYPNCQASFAQTANHITKCDFFLVLKKTCWIHYIFNLQPEPVGFKPPSFNNDAAVFVVSIEQGKQLTVMCNAQAFPVPVYR